MSNNKIDDLLERLQQLKAELESEIDAILTEKRRLFKYSLEQGKVRFEASMQAMQRPHKVGLVRYLFSARLGHLLTVPIIYSLVIAFVLMDIMVSIYQRICFKIYGIPRVDRKDYIIIDRQQLVYLNGIEKIHCMYCGYCNGLMEYVREVSARTEQYWCPIKHARRTPEPHRYVEKFVDYGDAKAYKNTLKALQSEISELKEDIDKKLADGNK